jgi:hypothetical protein
MMECALSHQEARRWDEAIRVYEEALAVCSEHLDSMYNKAICLVEKAEVCKSFFLSL